MFVHSSPTAIWHFRLSAGARPSLFVTQLRSWGPGTADEAGSASVRLCPACPVTSINQPQKMQHKGAISRKALVTNPKSPDSAERRRSPRQRRPTAALPACPPQSTAPRAQGRHSLLQLNCGRGDGFFPALYLISPPSICMLTGKIGGVVSAHGRKV